MGQDGFFTLVNPPSLGRPSGFSHGLLAPSGGRLLFVAGQTPADERGHIRERGVTAQFEAALPKALAVVEAGGGPREHVARLNIYVPHLRGDLPSRPAL